MNALKTRQMKQSLYGLHLMEVSFIWARQFFRASSFEVFASVIVFCALTLWYNNDKTKTKKSFLPYTYQNVCITLLYAQPSCLASSSTKNDEMQEITSLHFNHLTSPFVKKSLISMVIVIVVVLLAVVVVVNLWTFEHI